MANYTLTHLHSDMSNGVTNIDSITKYDDYIEFAKNAGMKALCFTEHGNVFGWKNKKEHIENAGMKYIHGIEAYVTESLEEKIRDNYHCVLIAKNYDGVKEINKLSSMSFNRDDGHYYYVPRITFDELISTSDNIIITTACLGGILNKGNEDIKERFLDFLIDNKDRVFLEIQHHNIDDQIKYNKYLYSISKDTGISLIVGTDTHALNEEHLNGRKILQKAKGVVFADETDWDLSAKTYDELLSAYEVQDSLPMDIVKDAIENTNRVADMVEEFELDKSYKYPKLWDNPSQIIRQKIFEGIKKRGVDKYPNYNEYIQRIKEELKTYEHNGAIEFMLLMADVIDWCNENGIDVGYGRGSANGSIVSYLLGITEMDSIKYNLNFERFMNTERVSLADIDTDFPPSRIEDVKQYLFNKHGLHCSDIITFNTIADKGAIRDVARALGIPLDEVANICDAVDNEDSYKKVREEYKKLFSYVDIVKGTIVSVGSHPCGTIVCDFTLDDTIGTFTTKTSSYPISQINMKEVDSLNFVKLDLLKLDTIELINETCKLADIERLTPDNVDIDDDEVWKEMREDTTGIFQWEGNTGNDYIKKLMSDKNINNFKKVDENIDRMTLLSIGNSAIRPAGASYREDLANGVVRKTGAKPIDDFLSSTFGYLVFQEQIIQFLHEYCGFTMGEADVIRRGFAKKTGTDQYIPIIKDGGYMPNDINKEKYINGYIKTMKDKYGIDEQKSEKDITAFIQVIEDASSYLFSLNHSQPYSFEGYVSAWLRTHYPLQFLTVALQINKDNEKKTKALTEYAKKKNIPIVNPRFGYSRAEYFCDKNDGRIYKGIGSIKFLNNQIAEELYELSKTVKIEDFVDLLFAMKETSINTRQRDILIYINFFADYGDINKLIDIANKFDKINGKKNIKNDGKSGIPNDILLECCEELTPNKIKEFDFMGYLLHYNITSPSKKVFKRNSSDFSLNSFLKYYCVTDEDKEKYALKTTVGTYKNIDSKSILKKYMLISNPPKSTSTELMRYQLEYLGYIDYINPDEDIHKMIVYDLDTKYTPRFKAYCIKNGKVVDMKVRNKRKKDKTDTLFSKHPFKDGSVLWMNRCTKNPKMKKDGDSWVKTNEYEWVLAEYTILN